MANDVAKNGFTILPNVFGEAECKKIANELAEALRTRSGDAIQAGQGRVVGGRNLLSVWDGWRNLVQADAIQSLIRRELGAKAGVVRILYFDKPPGKGWALSMHKDRTISVKEHTQPLAPFSKPTTKAGVPHVEATTQLLERMLTLRIHLDPMHDNNGPLVVIPQSHFGDSDCDLKTIFCDAGDVFVMRPLLSHSSRAANPTTTDHRRVVHLELAPDSCLPGKCQWHEFAQVF